MKVARVVALVNRCRTPEDALEAGLPMQLLGTGAYRKVFDIVGTGLVVKFPNPKYCTIEECVSHSVKEHKSISKILAGKQYISIKKHMPKVYYCNATTGVIVARKYKMLSSDKGVQRRALSLKIKTLLACGCIDVDNSGNVGIDGRGTLKVIDAGYIHGI